VAAGTCWPLAKLLGREKRGIFYLGFVHELWVLGDIARNLNVRTGLLALFFIDLSNQALLGPIIVN